MMPEQKTRLKWFNYIYIKAKFSNEIAAVNLPSYNVSHTCNCEEIIESVRVSDTKRFMQHVSPSLCIIIYMIPSTCMMINEWKHKSLKMNSVLFKNELRYQVLLQWNSHLDCLKCHRTLSVLLSVCNFYMHIIMPSS